MRRLSKIFIQFSDGLVQKRFSGDPALIQSSDDPAQKIIQLLLQMLMKKRQR